MMLMRTGSYWWTTSGRGLDSSKGRLNLPMPENSRREKPDRPTWIWLAPLVLSGLLALAACASGQTVVAVDNDIVGNTLWARLDGIYLVTRSIEIAEGGRLTLEPGVVVKFRPGTGLTVRGTLMAVGAPGDSIYFTSTADDNIAGDLPVDGPSHATATDWNGIDYVGSGSNGSAMQYCEVWFGGGEQGALITCDNASPSISSSSLNAGTYGLLCDHGASPRLSATRINGCLSVPLALSPDSDPAFDAVVFGSEMDNGYDGIGLLAGDITRNARLPRRDARIGTSLVENVTYVLLGQITVGRDATLRLQAGLVFKAGGPDAGVTVRGRLEAQGSADSAIVFTSVSDDNFGSPHDTNRDESRTAPMPGDWGGLVFADSSSGVLGGCHLRFGGGTALVETGYDVDLVVDRCVLEDAQCGLSADEGTDLDFTGNEVRSCRGVPIEIAAATNLTQADNVFRGNGITAVGIHSGDITRPSRIRMLDIGGYANISYFVGGRLNALASLDIDPGLVLKFAPDFTGIDVKSSLVAAGNELARIVFTSVHDDCTGNPLDTEGNGWEPGPCPGDWGGIRFEPGYQIGACLIDYCNLTFGGHDAEGVINASGQAPTISNCIFQWNLVGLQLEYFADGRKKEVVSHTEDDPWRPSMAGIADLAGNEFGSNVIPILCDLGGRLTRDTILGPVETADGVRVVNRLASDLIVPFGITLTLASGLDLAVGPGGILVQGALIADATADHPIDIHGLGPRDVPPWSPGSPVHGSCTFLPGCDLSEFDPLGVLDKAAGPVWSGITFENTSDDAVSLLRNVHVMNAETALTVRHASPVFSAVTVESATIDGIRIEGRSRPVIEDCIVRGCGRVAVAMSLMADPRLTGNQFLNNGYEGIGVLGETLARDFVLGQRDVAQRKNLPYLILDDLAVGAGVSLALEPGLKLKFFPGCGLSVAHSLRARGGASPDSLIVFTSIADDFYGGDSNRDGAATEGGDAPWDGVQLERTTALGEIALQNCVFRYAGATTGEGALNVGGTCSPTIADCTFAHNLRGVVFREAGGDPQQGGLDRCDFFGNQEYAVLNLGRVHEVRARDCWWGDASGPFDDSDDIYAGGLFNLSGLGDPVSDGVDYFPWRGQGNKPVQLGDVSLNQEVTAYDASLVLQGVVGEISLTPQQARLADVTCTAGVTAFDAACILRFTARLSTYFPCEADSVATKSLATRPLDLTAADATVHLQPVPGGVQGSRYAVNWSGTTPLLSAEIVLRAEAGARIVAVAAGTSAREASVLTRAPYESEIRIALAAPEPLPVGTLVEFELANALGAASSGADDAVTIAYARLNERTVVSEAGSAGTQPPLLTLMEQNRPNPFNPATLIRFTLSGMADARIPTRITIHDQSGRRIRVLLVNDLAPGTHEVLWDGRSDGGTRVASGVYLYRVEAGEHVVSRKMTLLK